MPNWQKLRLILENKLSQNVFNLLSQQEKSVWKHEKHKIKSIRVILRLIESLARLKVKITVRAPLYPLDLYIFYPIFHCGLSCRAVSDSDYLFSKEGNSSIFGSKIRSL